MVKLGIPHIVISVPRLIISAIVIGLVAGSTQLVKPTTPVHALHTQDASVKHTTVVVPYTAPPQPVTQSTPTPVPQTIATVTKVAAPTTVTQSTVTAPVVTPATGASVSGLVPVAPTTPTTGGSSSGATNPSQPTTTAYTSTNWSGYVVTAGNYTGISGAWTVPSATANDNTTSADSAWIGIGGVSSDDLVQVGTDDTVAANGTETTSAFYELLPRSARNINVLNVKPGDSMTASLAEIMAGQWRIIITDTTTGQSYTTLVSYTSSHSTAEWIEEDPSTISNHLVPLDLFALVSFASSSATTNGSAVTLTSGDAQPITLVSTSGTAIASPSAIDGTGQGFTVTRSP